jgi:hypothetical protein
MRARGHRYGPLGNQLVQSDLGRDDPPAVAATKPPKAWEQRQIDQQGQQTAAMNALNQMVTHLGGLLDLALAPPAGDVLASGTRVIEARGALQVRWPTPFAALHIANLSAGTLTVGVGPNQTAAPQSRTGVFMVPGGIARTIAVRDTVATIYGTPGSVFDITAFSRPRDPSSGVVDLGTSSGVLVAPGTTAPTTTLLTEQSSERLVLVLNVAATTGSVNLLINGVTPSGYVYPLLDPTAVTAASVTPYRIGPGLTPSLNAVANDVVPELVQVVAVVTGTATYGIDFVAGR